ncbi:hypothetical protein [Stutzerimonas stutzeri]|uniref:hypothetical protein n=1 Tax=Stutzerimonas stutzeri TaxID=316 RepID=UPI001BCF6179|nr:hypothetical protein [Stutzerimonas stutzeri]
MKPQEDYTEADRIYGAWLAAKNRINKIDYGQADEDWEGERRHLHEKASALEAEYEALTGESIKQG